MVYKNNRNSYTLIAGSSNVKFTVKQKISFEFYYRRTAREAVIQQRRLSDKFYFADEKKKNKSFTNELR